jgi:hypothetical protein
MVGDRNMRRTLDGIGRIRALIKGVLSLFIVIFLMSYTALNVSLSNHNVMILMLSPGRSDDHTDLFAGRTGGR